MAAIFQTTFSNVFSWMKMYELRFKFHWNLFLRVQLTIFHHSFRYWLAVDQAPSHYLNQWWLEYGRIYASLGRNELYHCVCVCVFVRGSQVDRRPNRRYYFYTHYEWSFDYKSLFLLSGLFLQTYVIWFILSNILLQFVQIIMICTNCNYICRSHTNIKSALIIRGNISGFQSQFNASTIYIKQLIVYVEWNYYL